MSEKIRALTFLYEHHRKLALGYKRAGEDEAFEIEGRKAHKAFKEIQKIAYGDNTEIKFRGGTNLNLGKIDPKTYY